MKKLLVPLKEVVAQAKSVGERRFTKIAIPSTREFADVARSMNELSDRVETMLVNEASALREREKPCQIKTRQRAFSIVKPFLISLRQSLAARMKNLLGPLRSFVYYDSLK